MTKWAMSKPACPTAPPLPRTNSRVHPFFAPQIETPSSRGLLPPLHSFEVVRCHQHQMGPRFHRGDHLPGAVAVPPGQPDGVADTNVLPFRVDDVRVVDVRSDSPLQQRVAVEAAAVLADLRQPWPDRAIGASIVTARVVRGEFALINCSITKFRGGLTQWVEPSMSSAVAQAIGATNAMAFDVSNACAGYTFVVPRRGVARSNHRSHGAAGRGRRRHGWRPDRRGRVHGRIRVRRPALAWNRMQSTHGRLCVHRALSQFLTSSTGKL